MKKMTQILGLLLIIILDSGCIASLPKHTLDDFNFLEKGIRYEDVIQEVGEPQDQIVGSSAFITYVYEVEEGNRVYLGFLRQADYLDTAYIYQQTNDGDILISLIPPSLSLPAGVQRQLILDDFEGLVAGIRYFPDVYNQVGPPNDFAIFEGGSLSLIYYLGNGERIALNSPHGFGCISRIGYSPESFGGNWTVLSEDTEGICEEK